MSDAQNFVFLKREIVYQIDKINYVNKYHCLEDKNKADIWDTAVIYVRRDS